MQKSLFAELDGAEGLSAYFKPRSTCVLQSAVRRCWKQAKASLSVRQRAQLSFGVIHAQSGRASSAGSAEYVFRNQGKPYRSPALR